MATEPMKILFVSSEVDGIVKTGGLADVAKALPLALKRLGHDIRVVMPLYKMANVREKAEHLLDATLYTESGHPNIDYKVFKVMLEDEVTVYLIDCPHYFERDSLYAEHNQSYPDNGERFAFFAAAALHSTEMLGFQPQILHCNDWHAGLIPYLLKTRYANSAFFHRTKSVITIHNAAFQGIFARSQLWAVPEVANCYKENIQQDHAHINFLKCAILYADKINGVSPNYAAELLTPLGAHGVSHLFQERASDLSGIINGCDYSDWDPKRDRLLPYHYDADDMQGKQRCKRALQDEVGLEQKDCPVFGMVCRLTEQKGVHLLIEALQGFLLHDVQVVIVGTGDPTLAGQLHSLSKVYPQRLKFINAYSNELAHLVEAGSDFFLMPSLFEPCGLNQMYSLAYGTLPVVRGVGGLKDTVVDYDTDRDCATGFVFDGPTGLELLATLRRVLLFYLQQPTEFVRLQQNAMQTKFDWNSSALQYLKMYQSSFDQLNANFY
ncbi:glycogen synthase GlgA [Dongshaea marina]|uniref:glycogen synthase GlgA n=1 Tax=Dongshaea marina TaxID=2047966 RepID=UPI000D3EC848|nr:glycogen synthase GlgA [Dongshaea marina]